MALLSASALTPSPVAAAALTFTVNRVGDVADLNPGNGKCDTSTATGNQCTLRAAIQEANAHVGADVVKFGITSSSKVIKPATALPPITEKVTINGYSQSGASANTLATGDDAVLKVVLSGDSLGDEGVGLDVETTGATIKGLNVQGFGAKGILVGGSSNVISGNFVGTNANGTQARPNLRGIYVSGSTNTIGGTTPADRNLVSGNDGEGIAIRIGSSNVIQGNYVGTTAPGTAALGNGRSGVDVLISASNLIGSSTGGGENLISGNGSDGITIFGSDLNVIQRNRIGAKASGSGVLGNEGEGIYLAGSSADVTVGGSSATGNLITGNSLDGIATSDAPRAVITGNTIVGNVHNGVSAVLQPATISGNVIVGNGAHGVTLIGNPSGIRIQTNQIFANAGLGIDLQGGTEDAFGVTANDLDDPDSGANHLQNFPVLSSAIRAANGVTTISGSLNSLASTKFVVEFYIAVADGSGHGEGQIFLGSKLISTNSGGDVSFTLVTAAIVAGQQITATAIRDANGDTSEFSNNVPVIQQ